MLKLFSGESLKKGVLSTLRRILQVSETRKRLPNEAPSFKISHTLFDLLVAEIHKRGRTQNTEISKVFISVSYCKS